MINSTKKADVKEWFKNSPIDRVIVLARHRTPGYYYISAHWITDDGIFDMTFKLSIYMGKALQTCPIGNNVIRIQRGGLEPITQVINEIKEATGNKNIKFYEL